MSRRISRRLEGSRCAGPVLISDHCHFIAVIGKGKPAVMQGRKAMGPELSGSPGCRAGQGRFVSAHPEVPAILLTQMLLFVRLRLTRKESLHVNHL